MKVNITFIKHSSVEDVFQTYGKSPRFFNKPQQNILFFFLVEIHAHCYLHRSLLSNLSLLYSSSFFKKLAFSFCQIQFRCSCEDLQIFSEVNHF